MKKNITVKVTANSSYLVDQSVPEEQRFLWSYEISIENTGNQIVQILNRHWRITDMTGHVEEVSGPGVVGLQPIIKPGKKFSYTSFCQLKTPQGTMEGYYEIQDLDEKHSAVDIEKFVLASPATLVVNYRSQLH